MIDPADPARGETGYYVRSWPELTRPTVEEMIYLASQALQTHYPASLQVATEAT